MRQTTFSRKIISRFLIILTLMAILGIVTYLAFIKMEHLSKELNQTLLLDMFLDETMGSHRKWMNDLAHVFLLGRSFQGSLNYYCCDFGKWYYSFHSPDREIKKIHEQIEKPHRILHQSAEEIVKLYRPANEKMGHLLADKKNDHMKWMCEFYKAIESKDKNWLSTLPIEEDICSFGQWYNSHQSYDLELEKHIQSVGEPHQIIHLKAKEILTLCQKNQWEKANKLLTEKIFPANEQVLQHFADLETLVHERIDDNQKAKEIYISRTVPAMEELQGLVDGIRSILMTRIAQLEQQYHLLAERSRHFIIFAIIFILFLAVLYAFLIPPGLTKPIRELTNFANRIAAGGNLSETITLANQDEIGQLASAFNEMILALRKSKQELEDWGKTLEKKVESRTKDLQEAYSQLERAQAHLVQSSKLASVGELAAGMAHEINNPMNVIMNYAELLQDEIKTDTEGYDYCQGIIKMGQRITTIIKKLLTFARQDNQARTRAFIPELIDEVLSFTKKRLDREEILIECIFERDLPVLLIQKNQMEQVFLNLIMNAKDALLEKTETDPARPSEKKLRIQVQKMQKEDRSVLQISFWDSGMGIKAEDLPRVFDPFFTTKRADKGTGLGLSISYGIVKEHGGNIFVESTRKEYTLFTIELPLPSDYPPQGVNQ